MADLYDGLTDQQKQELVYRREIFDEQQAQAKLYSEAKHRTASRAQSRASAMDANTRAQMSLDQREKEALRAHGLAQERQQMAQQKAAQESQILAERQRQAWEDRERKIGGKKRIDSMKAAGKPASSWGHIYRYVDRANPDFFHMPHVPR